MEEPTGGSASGVDVSMVTDAISAANGDVVAVGGAVIMITLAIATFGWIRRGMRA